MKENEETKPVLAYSLSKSFNEKQLKDSGKNYIILRLGSVYGYSTDTMRLDIMPNLFSKITSQNGTLKLFAGGRQIKSLVPLIDVARSYGSSNLAVVANSYSLSKLFLLQQALMEASI